MDGIELAARYSLMPNRFGYCGTTKFGKIFQDYLEGKADISNLRKELEKFPVHHSYLELIARSNGKKVFDYDVVEALWIGNKLLEKINRNALKDFISKTLVKQGLGKKKAKILTEKLPSGILPHHSFNSLYVKFVTDKVRPSIKNIDKCRIGWGQIRRVGKTKLDIVYSKIICKNNKLELKDCNESVAYKIGKITTMENPRVGDWVSTHWGVAVQKLDKRQLKNLRKYTSINLKALNNSKFSF